jgi:hypothetical protein
MNTSGFASYFIVSYYLIFTKHHYCNYIKKDENIGLCR